MDTTPPRPTSFRTVRSTGFTLIELMIVVAIASIATAFAAPAFLSTIRANRLDAASAELRAAAQLARSEAVKRAAVVVLEPINAGDWTGGLRVYVDGDQDLTTAFASSRDTVIRVNALRNTGLSTAAGSTARFGFDARGNNVTLAATNAGQVPTTSSVQLCASTKGRQITLNRAGIPAASDATC